MLEELFRQRQAVHAARGNGGRQPVLNRRPAGPRELVQRRPSLRRRVRVGTHVEEQAREFKVRICDRDYQRAGASRAAAAAASAVEHLQQLRDARGPFAWLRASGRLDAGCRAGRLRRRELNLVVGIRSVRHQHLDGVATSSAHGEQQRGKSPLRSRVDVGPDLDQGLDDLRVVFRGRPHQRGLAAHLLLRVHYGAVGEEQRDRFHPPGARRGHERSFTLRRHRVGVGPRLQKLFDNRGIAVRAGHEQRRDAVPVRDFDIRAGSNQQIHGVNVVALGGPLQRRRAVHIGRVDVGTIAQQRAYGSCVVPPGRVHQREISDARAQARPCEQHDRARGGDVLHVHRCILA